MIKISIVFIFVIPFFILNSCESPTISSNFINKYDFELLIPDGIINSDFNAISGIKLTPQSSQIGDTIKESTRLSYYAQFTFPDTTKKPLEVTLNNHELKYHNNSDSLRIPPNNDVTLYEANKWDIFFKSDSFQFISYSITVLDSIYPMFINKNVSSNQDLKLTWQPSKNKLLNVYLYFKSKNYTLKKQVQDGFGEAIISKDELKKLFGSCIVSFVRYYLQNENINSTPLKIIRITQRDYEINIF